MKRFWDTASIGTPVGTPIGAPVGAAVAPSPGVTAACYEILLDGRPMRLPSGTRLLVGPKPLAQALAAEWQQAGGAKGGEMSFADTPLTRLAGTAQERIQPDAGPTVDAIARYGETDLLCYRAESPRELVQRQAQLWQPWLDWAALTYDAPLRVTTGVGHMRQHHDSIAALRRVVGGLDSNVLAALGIAVPALGSLVLGLALAAGALDGETAFSLSILDELFQAEQWGEDAEAADRRSNVRADIVLAARYIALSRSDVT